MTMRDLHNNIVVRAGFVTAATDNTASVSAIIDTQGAKSCEFIFASGTLADADATFTTLIEDGDIANLSDAAAVADDYLLGTEAGASFTFADDAAVRKIGYNGNKRYVRATVTPANNTGAAPLSCVVVLEINVKGTFN